MPDAPKLILLLASLLAAGAADAEAPAVARAHLRGAGSAGAVFFLPLEGAPGTVAVGSAHAFDLTRLAESGEVEFRLGAGGAPVAAASRYLVRPGRAYHLPGATLRDDFVAFALTEPPRGVRVLEPAQGLPRRGDRVRILGVPRQEDGPEAQLLGTVVRSEPSAIHVDLDQPADLRGWGGAPVLELETNRVVGMLQSAWPSGKGRGMRIGVGPIGGVAEALAAPLDGGLGRLFATLAPPASAANSPAARRRAATGSGLGDQAPRKSAAEIAAATRRAEGQRPLAEPSLRLEIELPPPDAVVGDAAGVFVAGRALALPPGTKRFDVILVIDTSASTAQPTGVDVDGDGEVGQLASPQRRPFEPTSTDPGDSILAAEVAAAERLLAGLDPRCTRVGLVSFAGDAQRRGSLGIEVRRAALTQEPLTSDYRRLRRALDALRASKPRGLTHMAAGLDQATLELLGLPGSLSGADPESEKVVLFFTDGQPTLPDPNFEAGNVRAVLQSALRARGVGVRIHSFAIGPEALAGPISTVEMATITGGHFTPVRDPGSLVRFVETVSFANIDALEVRNLTSGERAYQVRVHADGSWDALVPLEPGENQLEVEARSAEGALVTERTAVQYTPGAPRPPIPVELVSKHNELLTGRLAKLRRQRVEALRRELTLEIERERAAAVERASRQRKELELELEPQTGTAPP